MPDKKVKKIRPVLGSNMLEGLFAELLTQVKASLDCCWEWHRTKLTQEENVVATWIVTMEETSIVVDVTQYHSMASLNKKHRYFVKRLRSFYKSVIELDVKADDRSSMKGFLALLTMWLQDSHLILSEETPRKVREYLSTKGQHDEEGGLSAEEPASEGTKGIHGRHHRSGDNGPGGSDPTEPSTEEGSEGISESGPDGSSASGVGVGVPDIRVIEEAWDCTANDS